MSKLGIDTEVKEAVLSHAKTGLTKVYELYDYAPEKRAALEKWCDHVRLLFDAVCVADAVLASIRLTEICGARRNDHRRRGAMTLRRRGHMAGDYAP